MSRKKKPRMEYRYYEAPEKCPVLALLGEKWVIRLITCIFII